MRALTDGDVFVSGTFWLTAVIVVLTVMLVALGIWTLVLARGNQKLFWSTNSVALLHDDHRLAGALTVAWQGQMLTSPTITTVNIRNASRRDIASSSFDGQHSITVTFDRALTALIAPESEDKNGLVPVRVAGEQVLIGPGLLRRRSGLDLVVLTDGLPLITPDFPLVDVTTKEEATAGEASLHWAETALKVLAPVSVTALGGVAILLVSGIANLLSN